MYDMYPDTWGPAAHDPANLRSREALQAALDRRFDPRDEAGAWPEDN